MEDEKTLVKIQNLCKHYVLKKNVFSPKVLIKAVDNISFDIKKGESLGLIGESGCGKTTTAMMILNLIRADQGSIFYNDIELTGISDNSMRKLRKNIQIIFQHSQGTLDSKKTVGQLLEEPLKLHHVASGKDIDKEVSYLLNLVELPESDKYKYPYQMSGGQRQRIGIARAISTRPDFIICDEPVSALDVSIQGQILNLLSNLKKEFNLTYLFISHDLKVVKHICNRIAVMYRGKIVEIGKTAQIVGSPKDEYTKRLFESTNY
jgi:peptide/nickel transport system ATP-binding protein/oligopeptide transport system ATP-binding protein